jgi:tetratricopeptide (TPR) repeat protein
VVKTRAAKRTKAARAVVQIPQDPRANLAAVARQYGLSPDEVDEAIRAWGSRTTDAEGAGQVALYARNYPKASEAFAESLREREQKLTADQKAVADSAYFLGQSLFGEGKYSDSVTAYQRCLQLRPDDSAVLANLALSLDSAGDYAAAELPSQRAVEIDEKTVGAENRVVAEDLNNLALLRYDEGNYASAEQLSQRALAIDEKASGPNHPEVAVLLGTRALILESEADYKNAEQLSRRALAIDEKALGPDHPEVSGCLETLALILEDRGDYETADGMFQRALEIDEKALGAENPVLAAHLSNLAALRYGEGNSASTEQLSRRALAIDEKAHWSPDAVT